MTLEGGCLCASVRYRLDPAGALVDYCHCRTCQRSSGAPVLAWAQVPPAQFSLRAGSPARHVSSPDGVRYFCDQCGTQLFMTDRDGRSVGVTVASLDEPDRLAPAAHGWTASKVSWLVIGDDLPRHEGDPPYDRS
jgi:hypothetical protein